MSRRPGIVVLGMLTRIPVAGIVCLTLPYLVGFERLGYDVTYLEEHGANPSTFMDDAGGTERAVAYLAAVMDWFGLGGKWCFHALHDDGAYHGLSQREVRRRLRDAALIVNLHGGTPPRPEHTETDRLVFLDTDPVGFQVRATQGDPYSLELAEAHSFFFTWGLNLGQPDCLVPLPDGIEFRPTKMPVLLDLWDVPGVAPGPAFTTVANWSQPGETLEWQGETYHWSKNLEFVKFLDLPRRTGRVFELALSSYTPNALRLLREHGWRMRHGLHLSARLNDYRRYVCGSRAEFTVAKDQNIRLRSGWFSDRSAAYLAAGRPVVTQDTGFGCALPTGEGLFAFSTLDEAAAAVEAICADYPRHSHAARELAREHFAAERVLADLLDAVGLAVARRPHALPAPELEPFPRDLVLEPASRRPTRLPAATEARVLARPIPFTLPARGDEPVAASVIVPVRDNLVLTRLCLESLVGSTSLELEHELVVVDNGSGPETRAYLEALAGANAHVRVLRNERNDGFAAAVNQGVRASRGDAVVVLNNDTIVPPGWLEALTEVARRPDVGLASPATNRSCCDAETRVSYRTYGELLAAAGRREGDLADAGRLAMFCTALRRSVYEQVGQLDERFGPGMFEDDDYVLRVRAAGLRVVVVPSLLVHHFGQSTVCDPATVPDFGGLFHENRRRFEEKWGSAWRAPRRADPAYERVVGRVREAVAEAVPPDARVLVVSKGDDALLALGGRRAEHFPAANGAYAGAHPQSSEEAIAKLEAVRRDGGAYLVFPETSLWWLDHYDGLRRYLEREWRRAASDEAVVIYLGERR